MARPLLLALVLGIIPAVLAGPACARRLQGNSSCVSQCGNRWGWPGRTMGDDPWGNVMKVTMTDMVSGIIATKQCKLRPSEAAAPVGNVASAVATMSSASTPPAKTQLPSSPPTRSFSPAATVQDVSSFNATTSQVPPPARTELVSSPTSDAAREPTTSPSSALFPTSFPVFSPSPQKSAKEAPTPSSPPPPHPPSTSSARLQPTLPPNSADTVSSSGGSASNSDIGAYLSAHNSVRAQHGASPLSWSDALASKAQQWADGCKFQHSGGSLGPFGENLAAGTGSKYSIDTAIRSWTDEVSEYDSNNPEPSHFTQVVWKGSSHIGCAVQSCDGIFLASFGKANYYVCEYQPQGNIIGAFAENVQA